MSRSHINIQTSYNSCGVLEVGSLLADPDKNAWEVANHFYHPARGAPEAFIMLSDVEPPQTTAGTTDTTIRSTTSSFVTHMCNKGFVSMVVTPLAINPKSGSVIRVWVLTVKHEEFKAWYLTEAVARLKRRIS